MLAYVIEKQSSYLWFWPKIENESEFQSCCTQIVNYLRLVGGHYRVRCFELKQNHAVHNKVGSKVANISPPEQHGHCNFLFNRDALFKQSKTQRIPINGLQKAVSEFIVNIAKRSNDHLSHCGMLITRIVSHDLAVSVSSVKISGK